MCIDYTQCTILYTYVLHYMHCVVLHRICQISTLQSGKIYTGQNFYNDAVSGVSDKYQVCSKSARGKVRKADYCNNKEVRKLCTLWIRWGGGLDRVPVIESEAEHSH